MNRDFKGVWISKEIWLNKDLSALDKVIFTEIHSLDNENGCIASNEYLSEFCQCSVPTITRSIKKLQELGLIKVESFNGRQRVIRVINLISLPNHFDESASSFCASNNIESNIDNNTNNSKELLQEQKRLIEKPKKKNLYQKCSDMIMDYTEDEKLRTVLGLYLKMRLEIRDKPIYANMWKGLLSKLSSLSDTVEGKLEIVQQSLDRGYLSFFPISQYSKKSFSDSSNDFKHENYYSDERYMEKEQKLREERERNGQKTKF